MNDLYNEISFPVFVEQPQEYVKDDPSLFGVNAQANDGADPPPETDPDDGEGTNTEEGETPADEGPFPVEPDGGTGDGAGPIPDDDTPIPVEPDGGIGDGAGPIPFGPFPVEPDGGIGDGAGPLPIIVSEYNRDMPSRGLVIATDDADTFLFVDDDHGGAIIGFDLDNDTLNLSLAATDFVDLDDLRAATRELIDINTGDVFGITIDLGNSQVGYIAGVSINDLDVANIIF